MNALDFFPKISLFDKGGKTSSILSISSSEFWLFLLAFMALAVFFWLIMREIRCWYWKVNLRTELLFVIGKELEEIKEILKNKNKVDNNEKIEEDILNQDTKSSIDQ